MVQNEECSHTAHQLSDLPITILTSCLRSFAAVKAFSGKLKVRLQSQENQIEIALMYPKGFVTLNIPIHIQRLEKEVSGYKSRKLFGKI